MAKKVPGVKVKKPQKKVTKPFVPKRPNINLLVSMTVLVISLFLIIFQVQQSQDMRGRTQVANCTVSSADMTLDSEEEIMLSMINQFRAQQGAPTLQTSPTLMRAASWLSNDMATTQKISHIDSLNRDYFVRWVQCGHPSNAGGEENVYGGNPSAQAAFEWWKNSTQGHKEAMLNPNYRYAGVARKGSYWTFAASGTSGDPNVTPAVTTVVPSPACLGNCPGDPTPVPNVDPTDSPSPTTDPNGPTIDPNGPTIDPNVPTVDPNEPTIDPNQNPVDPGTTPGIDGTITPQNPNGGNPDGGNRQGFLGLLLAFLMLIIQFFASLFGR